MHFQENVSIKTLKISFESEQNIKYLEVCLLQLKKIFFNVCTFILLLGTENVAASNRVCQATSAYLQYMQSH